MNIRVGKYKKEVRMLTFIMNLLNNSTKENEKNIYIMQKQVLQTKMEDNNNKTTNLLRKKEDW